MCTLVLADCHTGQGSILERGRAGAMKAKRGFLGQPEKIPPITISPRHEPSKAHFFSNEEKFPSSSFFWEAAMFEKNKTGFDLAALSYAWSLMAGTESLCCVTLTCSGPFS